MEFIPLFLLFILACLCTFYFPGQWLLKITSYKRPTVLANITLSLALGMCIFLFVTYLFSWFNLSHLYLLVILIFTFIEGPLFLREIKKHFSLRFLISFETLIILAGSILMVAATVGSGIEKNGQMILYGINQWDGIFHIALINDIVFKFPPAFPGLSGTTLHGYHIFYDFLLAQFNLLFKFNTYDLYFRWFSIFTAIFYGLSGLTLSYSLGMKRITRNIFLFLLFFAQGGEFFLLHWFNNADAVYNSGIVQPLGNIVDPSVLLSISFAFILYSVLFQWTKKRQLIIPMLILGVIPGIKIYTGILIYAALGIVALRELLKRKYEYFVILGVGGLLSAAAYLPFNLGAGSLLFTPLLFFKHFMESDMVLASFQWILKLQVYEAHNNIVRILYLYIIAFLFYLIPPLGIRLVIFLRTGKLFSKSFYSSQNLFWIIFSVVAFVLPVFFIQSIGVFNIVQFYWLLWIALLIPTAFSLTVLLGNVTKAKVIVLFIVISILSFTAINFPIQTIYNEGNRIVDSNMLSLAKSIQQLPPKATILVLNQEPGQTVSADYTVPLFAALAGRPVYYEGEQAEFPFISQIEFRRKNLILDVNRELKLCPLNASEVLQRQLHQNNIDYIVILHSSSCIKRLSSFKIIDQQAQNALVKVE